MLSLEDVRNNLIDNDFGFYKITNVSGTETYAGSHVDKTADHAYDKNTFLADFDRKTKYIPDGKYKIVLKRQCNGIKDSDATISYFIKGTSFELGAPHPQVHAPVMKGYTHEEVEERIAKRLAEERASIIAEIRKEQEIAELRRELAELKRNKTNNNGLEGIADIVKVIGLGVVSHWKPELLPTIEASLGIINTDDEEDEPRNFTRP